MIKMSGRKSGAWNSTDGTTEKLSELEQLRRKNIQVWTMLHILFGLIGSFSVDRQCSGLKNMRFTLQEREHLWREMMEAKQGVTAAFAKPKRIVTKTERKEMEKELTPQKKSLRLAEKAERKVES